MKNIVCFVFLFLVSCTYNTPKTELVELKGKNITVELPHMKIPFRIGVYGDKIAILDLAADSCFCHILSYPNFQYINSVGVKGSGPNEITLITPFQTVKDDLYILDGAKGNLYQYSATNEDFKFHHFQILTTIDFVCTNDSTLIIPDMSGDCNFIEATPTRQNKIFPLLKESSAEGIDKKYTWRKYMNLNDEKNKIVTATQFGDVVEIFDLDKNSTTQFIGKDGIPQDFQFKGYEDVKWVGNKVYALYSGKNDTSSNDLKKGGNIIRVFDESCNLVKTYQLDQYLYSFMVDNTNKKIVGINPNMDNPIYIFEF